VHIGQKQYFVTSGIGVGRVQWYPFFTSPNGTKEAPGGYGGTERNTQADPEEKFSGTSSCSMRARATAVVSKIQYSNQFL
jgi:hypothetical protein